MQWLEEGPWGEKRRAELIELFFLCVYRKTYGNTLSAGLCSIKEMWVFDVKTKDLAGLRALEAMSHPRMCRVMLLISTLQTLPVTIKRWSTLQKRPMASGSNPCETVPRSIPEKPFCHWLYYLRWKYTICCALECMVGSAKCSGMSGEPKVQKLRDWLCKTSLNWYFYSTHKGDAVATSSPWAIIDLKMPQLCVNKSCWVPVPALHKLVEDKSLGLDSSHLFLYGISNSHRFF